ncbi:MAG TPA: hypothetical protein VLE95_01870 [Chlamydiales bacterium]|nr:hypothetical protein [Chlamydiales bacterium]
MMKSALLRAIGPTKLIAYVKARGWVKTQEYSPAASSWLYKDAREEYEILLPLEQNCDDYALRVGDLLTTISAIENRPIDSIITDFTNSTSDIIRIKAYSQHPTSEKIPLEDGVRLAEKARDLILAAANSTLSPKAYHQTRRSSQVDNYLKNAEMGQTEKGSFVFTILITVPPALSIVDLDKENDLEEPFERKANKNLFQALDACRSACSAALLSSDIKPFEKAISQGVSANLCEALACLNESCGGEGLDLRMSWSLGRPAPLLIPSHIRFNNDAIPLIKEAARVFKETIPREDFEVDGFVRRLSKEKTKSPEVTIIGIVDGQPSKIMVQLGQEEHQKAITAYKEEIPIHCTGELSRRRGNVYDLLNPRKFELQTEIK